MDNNTQDTATAKTGLAEDRTDWAEDRTLLANERTFAAWMRTSMAAIAIALGLQAVFSAADPAWMPKLVATVFLAVAITIAWSARRQAARALKRLDPHDTNRQPTRMFTLLATAISVSSLAICVVLWTL